MNHSSTEGGRHRKHSENEREKKTIFNAKIAPSSNIRNCLVARRRKVKRGDIDGEMFFWPKSQVEASPLNVYLRLEALIRW